MLPPFTKTQYLTPDDFSVPCRLRRCDESSAYIEDGESYLSESRHNPEEITCTMRKWHKEATSASEFKSPHRRKCSDGQTKNHDAELIIAPSHCHRRVLSGGDLSKITGTNTPMLLSKRFASFGTPDFIDEEERTQYQQIWSDSQHQTDSLSSLRAQSSLKEDMTIPVNDITKVITRGEDDGGKKPKRIRKRSGSDSKKDNSLNEESRHQPTICITTSSTGLYELIMESTNEQLVVVTFLKANTKKGEVLFAMEKDDIQKYDSELNRPEDESKNEVAEKKIDAIGESSQDDAKVMIGTEGYESMVIETNASNVTNGTAQSTGERSFDVEAFTAKKMNERLETESITEKLQRRVIRLIASLDDLSNSLTKCACGCFGDTTVHNSVSVEKDNTSRPRKNTASTASLSDNGKVEGDSESSVADLQPVDQKTRMTRSPDPESPHSGREDLLVVSQLPSGLSVEPDDHLHAEDTANGNTDWCQSFLPPPVPVMTCDI